MPDEILFSPDEWIAVIEKAIAIVGEDHVSLGSDFDGGPTPPRGMRDISDLPRAHRRDAAPRMERGTNPQVPGRKSAACIPADHRAYKYPPCGENQVALSIVYTPPIRPIVTKS